MADDVVASPKIVITIPQDQALAALKALKAGGADAAKGLEQALGTALDGTSKKIKRLADDISGGGATRKLADLSKAFEYATREGKKLNDVQLGNLQARIQSLAAAGGTVPANLQKVTASVNGLSASLKSAGAQQVSSLTGQLGNLGGVLTSIGPGGVAAAAGLVAAATAGRVLGGMAADAINWADSISDAATAMGTTREGAQRLEHAAVASGVGFDKATAAVIRMQDALSSAPEKITDIGVSLESLKGLAPEQQLEKVAAALVAIQDPAQRNAAAIDIFGKSWQALAPLLDGGLEKMRDANVISEETVAGLDKQKDALSLLGLEWRNFQTNLGTSVAQSGFVQGAIDLLTKALERLNATAKKDGIMGVLRAFGAQGIAGLPAAAPEDVPPDPNWADGSPKKTYTYRGGYARKSPDELRAERLADEQRKKDEDARRKRVKEGADKLSGRAAVEELRLLNDQLAQAGGLANLSSFGLEEYRKQLDSITKAGGDTTAQLKDLNRELKKRDPIGPDLRAYAESFSLDLDPKGWLSRDRSSALGMARPLPTDPIARAHVAAIPGLTDEETEERIRRVNELLKIVKGSTVDWTQALQNLANTVTAMGGKAIFGQFLGGAASVGAGMQQIAAIAAKEKEILDAREELIKKGADIAPGLDLGQQIASGIGTFSAQMQMLSTAQQLYDSFKTAIGKQPWQEAGKTAARMFGEGISDELAHQIDAKANELGGVKKSEMFDNLQAQASGKGSRRDREERASLLFIGDVMAESERSAHKFDAQVRKLMAGIADKSIPAKEGLKALGQAWTHLADEAQRAGAMGNAVMLGVLKEAKALGQITPEMRAYAEAQASLIDTGLEQAAGGLAKTIGGDDGAGLKARTQVTAEAQARIFVATWNAAVQEKGLLGAAEMFKDALPKMRESMAEGGFDVSGIFGGVEAMAGALENEQFRGAAEAAQGYTDVLKGMGKAQYLNTELLQDFDTVREASYGQALIALGDEKLAMQAIAPLLAEQLATYKRFGLEVPASLQATADRAKDLNIAFPTDPVDRLIAAIERMEKMLGKAFGIDVETGEAESKLDAFIANARSKRITLTVTTEGGSGPSDTTTTEGGKGPISNWLDSVPGHSAGTFSTAPHLAMIHGTPTNPELVATLSDVVKGVGSGIERISFPEVGEFGSGMNASAFEGGGGRRSSRVTNNSFAPVINVHPSAGMDEGALALKVAKAVRQNQRGSGSMFRRAVR